MMMNDCAQAPRLIYTNDTFQKMRDAMNDHFDNHMAPHKLVKLDCDVDELWQMYLDGFSEEIKGIYREKPYHDCQACRHWFRRMGNVAALKRDGTIVTFFDFTTIPEYNDNFLKLSEFLHSKSIKDIFVSSDKKIGFEKNFEQNDNGHVIRNDHFFTILPSAFIKNGVKAGQFINKAKTNRQVLESTVNTISKDAIKNVLDLINDNNLYRGEEWKSSLKILLRIKNDVEKIVNEKELNNFYWLESLNNGDSISRMKNLSIGVLLTDLSNGMDIEKAVKRYESVVAPDNYQRPKAIFTTQMLENAKEKIVELGYESSIQRRFATIEDVSVKDTIFVNRNLTKGIQGSVSDMFNNLSKKAVTVKQDFYNVIDIDLKDFINDVLPKASEVFLYTDDNLSNNFMSLIAPVNDDAPSMFKWDNAFAWSYRNNVADSMKQQVKAMGGDVDVDLRFSIRWNNIEGDYDKNDLDAHCIEPNGFIIYYHQKQSFITGGWLDVDITDPKRGIPAVENIQFKDRKKMADGKYIFRVNQYAYRGGDNGFDAEIEFDNKVYKFNYPYRLEQSKFVTVASVLLKDGKFELVSSDIDPDVNNQTIWGVKMNTFVPVCLMCYSPNYWGDSKVGNKHVFFMLQDCVTDDTPNAWYNEFLNNELNENRQVMEALAREAKVESTENQLSGMGFSTTKKDSIIVKIIEAGKERIFNVII